MSEIPFSTRRGETLPDGFDLSFIDQRMATRAPLAVLRRPGLQRRLRLLGRLTEMGPGELLHRTARLAARWCARLPPRRREPAPLDGNTIRDLLQPLIAADPVGYMTRRNSAKGFFDPAHRESRVAAARLHCARDVQRTLHEADAIRREGIELLGKTFRPADSDFDWTADPDRGSVWPRTVMDDADAVRGGQGDVKFVWEVNRHQFLVTLARAHAYTGDEAYAECCVAMVRSWIRQNPAGAGVNWASSLELGLRSLSWVWAIQFLLGARALDDEMLGLWLASLRQHRDYLAAHLSVYTDPTNHLIGELSALAVLGIWLPEWDRGASMRDKALGALAAELERQVGDDGVDREHALGYQRFVLDFLLQVVAIAERNDVRLPSSLRGRAEAMHRATRSLVGSQLRSPHLGDGDDARGLPFATPDPWDFGDALSAAAAVLDPGTDELSCEAALWLAPGLPAGGLPRQFPRRPKSEFLPSGYAVLRNPAARLEDRLVFDCAPLGLHPHASHGHADLLSVLVDVGGEEVLVDPGTFTYDDASGLRNLFRSTRAHNTVEVGGHDQADPFDPFKWLSIPAQSVEVARVGSGVDYVEAWHDGYRRLRPSVRHRRGVLGLQGGWLLLDWLEGAGRQSFVRWFHASPRATIELHGSNAVRILSASTHGALTIQDLAGPGETPTAPEIGTAPHSERYGRLTAAPALRFADDASLPALRVTLLVPEQAAQDGYALRLQEVAGDRTAGRMRIGLREPGGVFVSVEIRASGGPTTEPRVAVVRGVDRKRTILSGWGKAGS